MTARARTVPIEHRYFASAAEKGGRVWLVDIGRGTTAEVVVTAESQPTAPSFSESRDGRRLIVGGLGPNARAALYLIDVESGRTALLYEDRTTDCSGCLGAKISPDASRYAFADDDGVLIGPTSGGSPALLVAHLSKNEVGGTWQAMAWAPDGSSLALWRGWESGSEIGIVNLSTRALAIVGPGHALAWREKKPELVITSSVTAFGGASEIYTYDLATSGKRQLEPTGRRNLGSPAWHPTDDRFVFIAGDALSPQTGVFIRALSGATPTKLGSAPDITEAWWSRDGARAYASVTRVDVLAGAPGVANLDIVELPSGRVVATVCRQIRCP